MHGCQDVIEERVLHRSSCLVCHQPLDDQGQAHGIEEAHPWAPLDCVDCHGGQAWVCDGVMSPGVGEDDDPTCDGTWVYDQAQAHVAPAGGAQYLKDLSPAQLDDVNPDYLRFINPGDLRVVKDSCGRCHTTISRRMARNTMAHAAGELTAARYRAGKQKRFAPMFGSADVRDPSAPDDACTAGNLAQFDPLALEPGSDDPLTAPTVANIQDHLLAKACMSCHLQSFGPNNSTGRYRSSGCSACHMEYADDGLSRSKDPWVPKDAPPHPIRHQMTATPSTTQCTHCHHDGGRIGLSFRGFRERGRDEEGGESLGAAMYGQPEDFYIVDEDPTNSWDETPADVHFEAGMSCIDCHTRTEVHGDGHLYASASCETRTRCVDCHGSAREYADPPPSYDHIKRRDDGSLVLTTKVDGKELVIPQTRDALTPGHPRYNEHAVFAKGHGDGDFTHSDTLSCQSCHSAWYPSCYGCHVEVDLTRSAPYATTGLNLPGAPTIRERGHVALNDLVLIWNRDGLLAPSMPAERLFLSLLERGADGETRPRYEKRPRQFTWPDGRVSAGFGQRAFDPHTTQRKSSFMACDRCHSDGDPETPANEALLDLTHGFGTDRFIEQACAVETSEDLADQTAACTPEAQQSYRLDAVMTRDGLPLVVLGHEGTRLLSLEEIARMRAIQVPSEGPFFKTSIPPDAASQPEFPSAEQRD